MPVRSGFCGRVVICYAARLCLREFAEGARGMVLVRGPADMMC
jgi:hypothetical protein